MEPQLAANSSQLCSQREPASCIAAITPSMPRTLTYVLVGGAVSFLTISGNLLVITSILYFRQLHTPTNYLMVSLAVADLLLGALVLHFNMALSLKSCLYFGDAMCKMRRSFDISLMMTSILNLCCISVDRYYAVCRPLTYRARINNCVVMAMILLSWAVSVMSGFCIIFLGLKNTVCEGRCFIFHIPHSTVAGSMLSFYLPVLVMLSIYLKILTVARRQARAIQSRGRHGGEPGAVASKRERKATRTLAVVMGVFLFCWTPFFLSITVNPLSGYSIPPPLTETLVWLGWSNSMLNPLVYGFFYSWFRAAFRIIISGKIFTGNFTNSKLM